MNIEFNFKNFKDIKFIPQWITKNVLSDWDEVVAGKLTSINEYTTKSYIVEGEVTYMLEENMNEVTKSISFYVPKKSINIDLFKDFKVNLEDLLLPKFKQCLQNQIKHGTNISNMLSDIIDSYNKLSNLDLTLKEKNSWV